MKDTQSDRWKEGSPGVNDNVNDNVNDSINGYRNGTGRHKFWCHYELPHAHKLLVTIQHTQSEKHS